MKKFCLAGAAAVLLIGTTAYGFAQSGDSSPKMSPGHEMQKRGSAPGSPGASAMRPAIATWISAARCVTAMTG